MVSANGDLLCSNSEESGMPAPEVTVTLYATIQIRETATGPGGTTTTTDYKLWQKNI